MEGDTLKKTRRLLFHFPEHKSCCEMTKRKTTVKTKTKCIRQPSHAPWSPFKPFFVFVTRQNDALLFKTRMTESNDSLGSCKKKGLWYTAVTETHYETWQPLLSRQSLGEGCDKRARCSRKQARRDEIWSMPSGDLHPGVWAQMWPDVRHLTHGRRA